MRRFYLIPFALIAVAAFGQEEEERDLAMPHLIALTMTDGSAASKEIESAIGRVRGAYEEKPVLFLTINLATVGGKFQGEMLFASLGLGPVWDECKKAPGQFVLVCFEPLKVLGKHGPKENLGAVLDKGLKDEGCGDGCGCDEGCGCDDK